MLVRRETLDLERVLNRLESGDSSSEVLLAQERHLRRVELLLQRVRYWNDRESALRERGE